MHISNPSVNTIVVCHCRCIYHEICCGCDLTAGLDRYIDMVLVDYLLTVARYEENIIRPRWIIFQDGDDWQCWIVSISWLCLLGDKSRRLGRHHVLRAGHSLILGLDLFRHAHCRKYCTVGKWTPITLHTTVNNPESNEWYDAKIIPLSLVILV